MDDGTTAVGSAMDNVAFKVTFECATAIRTLADVVSNMLETVDIQVIRRDDFHGIMLEVIDAKQISLVIARLHAYVEMNVEHTSFCVNARTFNLCVRSAQPHFSVCLESVRGTSSVRLTTFESLSNTSMTRFLIPTLVCEQEPARLRDTDYKYHIDMDTATLKSIVRMCLALQGETLTLTVKQRAVSAATKAARTVANSTHTILVLSSNGNCDQEHTFYSMTNARDDDSLVGTCVSIERPPHDDELEVMYEERFGAKHIADFLKSIEKNTLTLRLSREQPLIINHKFGSESSYVCLVVAPQAVET